MSDELVLQRVQRGERALDDYFGDPSWRCWVDVSKLDISDPSCCVLGQVFEGGYSEGLEVCGLRACAHGFADGLNGYPTLNRVWAERLSSWQQDAELAHSA